MTTSAKCALHAYGEFNLATSKELFSYGAKRNNLALQLVAIFSCFLNVDGIVFQKMRAASPISHTERVQT